MTRSFEIVDSHYANWRFVGADSVIDFGHHAPLIVGEPLALDAAEAERIAAALHDCRVSLLKDGVQEVVGVGANALSHPALALAHLAAVIASQPGAAPLAAGEIITTGTLTLALPIEAGATWRTETDGLDLPDLTVRFT